MLRNLFRRVSDLFAGAGEATDELFDELEEVLIASDRERPRRWPLRWWSACARTRGSSACAPTDGGEDVFRGEIAEMLAAAHRAARDAAPQRRLCSTWSSA